MQREEQNKSKTQYNRKGKEKEMQYALSAWRLRTSMLNGEHINKFNLALLF